MWMTPYSGMRLSSPLNEYELQLIDFFDSGELDAEEIRPITPDREALEAVARTIDDRAEHICLVQRELMESKRQQDLMSEQEKYAEVSLQLSHKPSRISVHW